MSVLEWTYVLTLTLLVHSIRSTHQRFDLLKYCRIVFSAPLRDVSDDPSPPTMPDDSIHGTTALRRCIEKARVGDIVAANANINSSIA